jgi:hypothetical protein
MIFSLSLIKNWPMNCYFFDENHQFFEVFETTKNRQFFDSNFIKEPKFDGYFKIQRTTQHWLLNLFGLFLTMILYVIVMCFYN